MDKTPSARITELISEQGSSVSRGLSGADAAEKLRRYGPNAFAKKKRRPLLGIMAAQASNSLILLLVFAAAISLILRHYIEGAAILASVLISVLFSSFLEYKADDAMEQLSKYRERKAVALRDGKKTTISSSRKALLSRNCQGS